MDEEVKEYLQQCTTAIEVCLDAIKKLAITVARMQEQIEQLDRIVSNVAVGR